MKFIYFGLTIAVVLNTYLSSSGYSCFGLGTPLACDVILLYIHFLQENGDEKMAFLNVYGLRLDPESPEVLKHIAGENIGVVRIFHDIFFDRYTSSKSSSRWR